MAVYLPRLANEVQDKSSYAGLTHVSIDPQNYVFETDGLPGIGERKRRRSSNGYARQ
jgi:hypothetical protein